MKKLALLFAIIMLITGLFLIACDDETDDDPNTENGEGGGSTPGSSNGGSSTSGGGSTQTQMYTVTFKVDGSIYKTVDIPQTGSLTFPDEPTKTGYTFEGWYDGNTKVTEITSAVKQNKTLTAKYDLITYTVTFKADGNTVSTREFNINTVSIDAPEVPEKTGYAGMWESYELGTENITVNAVYTAGDYTVTFMNGQTIVGRVAFTVDDTSITEPAVPKKQCYTGKWENYTLSANNITVNAVYTVAHTNLKQVARVDAKCNATGNIQYWSCIDCNKYFSNAAGTNEISDKSSVSLNKVPCSYVDCVCKWCRLINHNYVDIISYKALLLF